MKRRESVYLLIGITAVALFVLLVVDLDSPANTWAQSPLPTFTFTPPPPTATFTPVPPTATSTPTPADTRPPISRVVGLRRVSFTPFFRVRWRGRDPGGSGIQCYDVQYKDGAGAWQDWQTCTTSQSAWFFGQRGHWYLFRARATDNAGNVEDWPPRPDAWTYVRGR